MAGAPPTGRQAGTGSASRAPTRADHLIASARRREEALQIAIGDCRAQIFGTLVRARGGNAYH